MSNARRAALHLLNSDWSRGVWKHWLSNIFQPPVEPPLPTSTSASVAPAPATPSVRPPQPASRTAVASNQAPSALRSSCTEVASEPPDSARTRDARRSELRARFDALSDRLLAVEDGLETLLRRAAERDKLGRRSDRQSVAAIDTIALASERQASVLEGLLDSVSRLEQGLLRLEQGLSRAELRVGEREGRVSSDRSERDRSLGDRSRRDSHFPSSLSPSQPPRATPSQFPESQLAPRDRPPFAAKTFDFEESLASEAAGINGNLSEVSLSTVLAMLEIERHTGRLKVATEDGMLASFELTDGSVVSSRLSENDTDPLHTLRTALCWKQGRFWFRQQPAEAPSFPPRSIGSLLLEATRQNDESFANVG